MAKTFVEWYGDHERDDSHPEAMAASLSDQVNTVDRNSNNKPDLMCCVRLRYGSTSPTTQTLRSSTVSTECWRSHQTRAC